MKLAFIGHKEIPGRSGGVEVVVEELATRLAHLGVDTIAYNRRSKSSQYKRWYKGVRLHSVWAPKNKGLNALVSSYIATICAILSGRDVIHYHALGPSAALWLAKLFGKKVFVTVHGLNYKTPKWRGLGAFYIKFGEWLSLHFADEVIVLSRSIQRHYQEVFGRTCLYIPNGLSMPENTGISFLKNSGFKTRGYLLCVSRLVPGKGLELLIDVYRKIQTDVPLVIAGDSEYVDDFKRSLYERAGNDPRVCFLGFVEKDNLCELYANAALFVFPSEAEGMPMSLLEAMWFNCPCLVSDIQENLEVIGELGTSFAVGDKRDLEQKLREALNSPMPQLSTREIVREKYDWDKVAEQTLATYKQVMGEK